MLFSIVIRTKDEEAWIGRCLKSIFRQSIQDFEVTIIDSGSSDETLQIVEKFPVKKIIHIKNFLPGNALNIGIKESCAKYIVTISAHCVPVTELWLEELRDAIEFDSQNDIVAAYGRQIPIASSSPLDKRDLMNTFGLDFLIQEKDFFFHNANSIVLRQYLIDHPYSDIVTNVEDRIWAKALIDRGHKIAYTPMALVYHHHGLNHGNDEARMDKVSSLIEPLYLSDQKFESYNLASKATVIIASLSPLPDLISCIDEVIESDVASSIYVVSNEAPNAGQEGVNFIDRATISGIDAMAIPNIVQFVRNEIQPQGENTDFYVFLSPKVKNRPTEFLGALLAKAESNFLDVCFPATSTYQNLWYKSKDGGYKPVETNLSLKTMRDPQFKAYFNLGLVMSNSAARLGKLSMDHVGILEIDFDPNSEEIGGKIEK